MTREVSDYKSTQQGRQNGSSSRKLYVKPVLMALQSKATCSPNRGKWRGSLSVSARSKFRTGKQMIQSEIPIVSCANHPSRRWLFAFVLVALAAIAVPAFAQQKTEDRLHSGGYVEDWSSHHAIFSNPGTEQDAQRRGEHDRWLKIVNDERYMMQQRRRNTPPRWGGWGHDEISLQRDWSMSVGAQSLSTLTLTVSSAPSATTVSSSSTLTIDGQTFTASAPTAEVETIAFSQTQAPGNTTSISIGGTEYEFITSGSVATPASGCEVAAVDNTAGATDLYDALTAKGTPSNSTYRCATGAAPNPAISTSSTSVTSRTITVTSALAAFATTTAGTTHLTTNVTTAGSDGADSDTGFQYVNSNTATYDQYDTEAQLANDLYTAINDNATVTSAVSLSYTDGGTSITLSNQTGASDTVSDASFSALGGTGT
jgi:hypothetical protein